MSFISETDLNTFDGWLQYQGIDAKNLTQYDLEMWRDNFDDSQQRLKTSKRVGITKSGSPDGEYRYAVAVRDQSELWLALWVRRSKKGEYFFLIPRGDRHWDPHTSYHLDGRFHMKSFNRTFGKPQQRQPLGPEFRGMETMGAYSGYGPRSVGAICNPAHFTQVIAIPSDVLGPRDGSIAIDLIERGHEYTTLSGTNLFCSKTFCDGSPWLVISIYR